MGKSIVFTVTTDLNHDQRMQRIASTLANAGFAVTLVGRELPTSLPLRETNFRQRRLQCFFHKGPLFYLEYNLRLVLWFFTHRFDIYGTVDADTALAGAFTTAWRGKPMVFDAHELFPEMPEVTNRKWVKRVWAWLEDHAFTRATVSYTVSASLVGYFQHKFRKPVGLVRNMPFRKTLSPKEETGQPYFIYQGALNVGRGLENMIAAMPNVPAQLVLCGDGPLRVSLEEQVRELQLEAKVKFKGNVVPEDLALLTRDAFAGLMLLDNQGLSYYYSLANKFFDYVQAGIPQVCVPFPEYQTLNKEYEVALLAENNLAYVREAMLTLLQDKKVYKSLQENCLKAREVWNWEQEEQKLVSMYQNLK